MFDTNLDFGLRKRSRRVHSGSCTNAEKLNIKYNKMYGQINISAMIFIFFLKSGFTLFSQLNTV